MRFENFIPRPLYEAALLFGKAMSNAALTQEAIDIVRSAEDARSAIERDEWAVAERTLTEAQDRIGRLLREVGDKQREAMLVPQPDEGDRG